MVILASASWMRLALTFVVGILLTPLLLKNLGASLYGVFMMVSLTILTADPISAVVNKACNRELTGAHSAGDGPRMRRMFTNGLLLAAMASCLTAVIPITLAIFAPHILNYAPEHDAKVRTALLGEGAIIFSGVLTAPWANLYWATQRFILDNTIRLIQRCSDILAFILAVVLPVDFFYGFVLSRSALQVGIHIARCFPVARAVPDARFVWALRDRAVVRSMASTGGWSFGDFAGRFGFYDGDHLILNVFKGPVYNAINGVVNQIRGYTRQLGVSMLFGVEAVAADLHERGRVETLRRVLIASTAHSFAAVGFAAIITGAFFGPLLDVWLGHVLRNDADLLAVMTYDQARSFAWLFLLLGLPGLLFSESHLGASNMLYGMGKIRAYAPIVLIAGVVRVGAVVLFLWKGASPLILPGATTVGLLLVYAGYFPILLARTVEMPWGAFVWRTYARPLLSLAPVALLAWWMARALDPWSLLRIALCCAALGALYAPLAFALVLDAHERDRALGLLRSLLRRAGLGR